MRALAMFVFFSISLLPMLAQQSSRLGTNDTPPDSRPNASAENTPTLLLVADIECVFTIDDRGGDSLRAGEIRKVPTTVGEHLVTAVTTDRLDRWQAVVNVDTPRQKVVRIELLKVRAAREEKQRETALSEEEAIERDRQAKAAQTATELAANHQATVKRQRLEIEDKIAALQKELRQQETAAQNDELRAQQSGVNSATGAAQGTALGNLTASIGDVDATNAANSARLRRQRAAQLRDQITELNRQLQTLNLGQDTLSPESIHNESQARTVNDARSVAPQPPSTPMITGSAVASMEFVIKHTADGFRGSKGVLIIRSGEVDFRDSAGHALLAPCDQVKTVKSMDKMRGVVSFGMSAVRRIFTLSIAGNEVHLEAENMDKKREIYVTLEKVCGVK